MKLQYFGTDLKKAGHYFFDVGEERLYSNQLRFDNLIFNPEFSFKDGVPLGHVCFYHCGAYSLLRIEGSPIDKRGGCKSLFFVNAIVPKLQLMNAINSSKVAMEIISKIPTALDKFNHQLQILIEQQKTSEQSQSSGA